MKARGLATMLRTRWYSDFAEIGQALHIAQAAFLRVYERIHQFQVERPFAPWFFRSIVNDALMSERWKRRASHGVEPVA